MGGFFGQSATSPLVLDSDASAYISEVESADGQSLETEVKEAINDFVVGCKNDNIWADIKAACILCGARTLNGALKPLVGTAPTNVGFVSGDYSRAYGILGNGTAYLNSNRNNNADPQDDFHMSCFVTRLLTTGFPYMGAPAANGTSQILNSAMRSRNTNSDGFTHALGLLGQSRSASGTYLTMGGLPADRTTVSVTRTSETPSNSNIFIFARSTTDRSNARIAFYSIGEATDLVLLNKNVTRLVSAMQGFFL